jgi:hypothetical protein
MSKEKKEYTSYDIVESDKLFGFPNFVKLNSKITNILVEASIKAQTNHVQVVEVKGTFSDEEVLSMKYIMKEKGYDMWKYESGYVFTPIKKKELGFKLSNQNTIPWGGNQQHQYGWNFQSGSPFDNMNNIFGTPNLGLFK